MKLLAILIAFILLAGSLDFCQESASCEDGARQEVCSPLCHCSGCVFSILLPTAVRTPEVTTIILSEHSDELPSSILHMSYSIWQPPRLMPQIG